MQAVIMAAGRGTRLGELTKNQPKPLIPVCGKPILDYTFEVLPPEIDEVILVVNYLSDMFKDRYRDQYGRLRIRYIEQKDIAGTAGAVWQARDLLNAGERFLVLNGDDIYNREELQTFVSYPLAVGLVKCLPSGKQYLAIETGIVMDEAQMIKGTMKLSDHDLANPILIATGAYALDHRIFDYKPVRLSNGEFGLPHTIFVMAKDYPVQGVIMDSWIQINYPEDIAKAEAILKFRDNKIKHN